MKMYKIESKSSARKEFARLPKKIRDKVVEGLRVLATNPFSDLLKIKKLRGTDCLFRFRVGDYRVVYEVCEHVLVVVVIKIGHRKDIYRKL